MAQIMKCLNGYLLIALISMTQMAHAQLVDFTDPQLVEQMWVVNDNVMGGVSESRYRHDADGVIIEGTVSLENNGGFASTRSKASFAAGVSILELTVKGDGKRYKFILRTDPSPQTPMYQADFVAVTGWNTYRFSPRDFRASFRGRAVDAPALVFSEVREMGLLIADKQAGPFQIQVQRVAGLRSAQ
jgi:hypothetical protein